jgi:hypothetical protein
MASFFDFEFEKNKRAKTLERMSQYMNMDPSQKNFYENKMEQRRVIFVCSLANKITYEDEVVVNILEQRFPYFRFDLLPWDSSLVSLAEGEASGFFIFIAWNNLDSKEKDQLEKINIIQESVDNYCVLSIHKREYPYESLKTVDGKIYQPPSRIKKRSEEKIELSDGSEVTVFHFFIAEKKKKISEYSGDKNEVTFYFFSEWLKEKTKVAFRFELPRHLSLDFLTFSEEFANRVAKNMFYNKKENGDVDLEVIEQQKLEKERAKETNDGATTSFFDSNTESSDSESVYNDSGYDTEKLSSSDEKSVPDVNSEPEKEGDGFKPYSDSFLEDSGDSDTKATQEKSPKKPKRRYARAAQKPFWEEDDGFTSEYSNSGSDSESVSENNSNSDPDSESELDSNSNSESSSSDAEVSPKKRQLPDSFLRDFKKNNPKTQRTGSLI